MNSSDFLPPSLLREMSQHKSGSKNEKEKKKKKKERKQKRHRTWRASSKMNLSHFILWIVLKESSQIPIPRPVSQSLQWLWLCFYLFKMPHPWHMEGPRPGTESEPELWPKPQLHQCWTFNPLWQAGDGTCTSVVSTAAAVGFLTYCATVGTPVSYFYTDPKAPHVLHKPWPSPFLLSSGNSGLLTMPENLNSPPFCFVSPTKTKMPFDFTPLDHVS